MKRTFVILLALSTLYSLLSTPSYAQEVPEAKKEDVQKYIAMLKSAKDEDREEAAEALAELADPISVDPLIEALLKDKDPYVRESAAFALGEIGDKKTIEPLLTALGKDEDPYVRESSAYSLSAIGDETTTPKLEGLLAKEKEAFVQDAIKDAINEIKVRKEEATSSAETPVE